jgi:hypothetical protein
MEEIKKLIESRGKVRGVVFQTDAEYVRQKKGEEGLKALEKKTKELGYPIDYDRIKTMDWYSLGGRVVSLLAAKEVFNWGNKEIDDMGNSAPKYSFVVKMLLKYFLSLRRSLEEVPTYWAKHYTVGELEFIELDEEKKYYIIRLKNFKIHPILCTYLVGYFRRFSQYVIKSKKITVEETKCMFKGDPYHEFVGRWE